MKTLLIPYFVALIAASQASAAITTSGNFQTGTPTPTLSITQPFSLTITTSSTARYLILDNWVTTDNTQSAAAATAAQFLFYTVDGGVLQQVSVGQLGDNFNVTTGGVTPGDGFLSTNPITVTAGQVYTFNANSLTFGSNSAFNPNVPTRFTGNVFLADISGNQLSNSVAIPEPSSAMLGFLVLPALLMLRRK